MGEGAPGERLLRTSRVVCTMLFPRKYGRTLKGGQSPFPYRVFNGRCGALGASDTPASVLPTWHTPLAACAIAVQKQHQHINRQAMQRPASQWNPGHALPA